MPSPSDFVAGGTGDPEDGADRNQHQSDDPENRYAEQQPEYQQDEPKDDHARRIPTSRDFITSCWQISSFACRPESFDAYSFDRHADIDEQI